MIQTADTVVRDRIAAAIVLAFDGAAERSVLFQGVMQAVLMVVIDSISDEPPKVCFIHRDHVVEDFPVAASDPSFGGSVLPWCVDARPRWFQCRRLQERGHRSIEDRVVAENHVSEMRCFWKRLTQLRKHPVRSRVAGHVEVEDLPTSMGDHEKAVHHVEGQGWHREEVEGCNPLAVVLAKCKPSLGRIAKAGELDAGSAPQFARRR